MKTRITGYVLIAILLIVMLLGGGNVLIRYYAESHDSLPPSTGENTTILSTYSPDATTESTTLSTQPTKETPGTLPGATETTLPSATETEPTTTPPTTAPTEPVTQPTEPSTTGPVRPLPQLSAKAAFVYDARTGEYLFLQGDATAPLYPASITKLFTTYVALQYLPLDTVITVGQEVELAPWDSSLAGFCQGDVLTVEDVTYAAMLISGCDASYVLAAAAGRAILNAPQASVADAIAAFMEQVNRMAADFGMVNTHFVTPDGNHDDNHTLSMQACVEIARLCMENEDLAHIAGTYRKTISYTNVSGAAKQKELRNTNENMNPDNDRLYLENTLGLKTGYTAKAGYCFLGTYQVDGGYLVVGVFGCPDPNGRFQDTVALVNYFMECLPDWNRKK